MNRFTLADLEHQAEERNMEVDYETFSLRPKATAGLDHNGRATFYSLKQRREAMRDHYDQADNDPASPMEAFA